MNEPMSTPCPEWEEKLAGIDLDDLSTSEREALNLHLLSCPACASTLADYQRMDLLIDQALTSDLPLELPEDFAARKHSVGQTAIPNCRLKHIVEKGKFTSVYVGEHVHLNKPVVVKLHHMPLSKKEKQSFHREARKLVELKHPNILPVLDFGIHEEKPFLVMDHVPYSSLRERHPRGLPVPLPEIVSYLKKIAEVLQYAHDRKIIHRNLRPENILISSDNDILLTDFGIPAIHSNLSHPSTGAHFYMAPEQFHGKHHVASDQYALGVMVYEWLTGERPFYGSPVEIATKHHESPPPPLHKKVPALSPDLEKVVMKALAKQPEMRFKSVLAFAAAFEEASTY